SRQSPGATSTILSRAVSAIVASPRPARRPAASSAANSANGLRIRGTGRLQPLVFRPPNEIHKRIHRIKTESIGKLQEVVHEDVALTALQPGHPGRLPTKHLRKGRLSQARAPALGDKHGDKRMMKRIAGIAAVAQHRQAAAVKTSVEMIG